MGIDAQLLDRLDLREAIELELSMSNRLMPRRPDRLALMSRSTDLLPYFRNRYSRGIYGDLGDVVFVEKNRRGRRPITEMTLSDKVLFRALVALLSESLPSHLLNRMSIDDFRTKPALIPRTRYVSKTDIASYYEFIDHERLAVELEAQTGEAPAVAVLMDLLGAVMGRRLGLPQVHRSSDILGDTYIDPVRRRLRRAGFDVVTYSDDFRISSRTLADARAALEACAREVRTLGLALNESKTYTYTQPNYLISLSAFEEAEKELFRDSAGQSEDSSLLLGIDYADESDGSDSNLVETLAASTAQPVLEEDVLHDEATSVGDEVDPAQFNAAKKAWDIWVNEDESEEKQSSTTAAITETLLGRALPILGQAGFAEPLGAISALLRFEPALTPQISTYLTELGRTGPRVRVEIRTVLDTITNESSFSLWQKVWLAEAAGTIRPAKADHPHYGWLKRCVGEAEPALAATAAVALGKLRRGDSKVLAAALDRVGPSWRTLVLAGMASSGMAAAEDAADDMVEHILLQELQ